MLTDQTKDSIDFLKQYRPYSYMACSFICKKIYIIIYLYYFDFELISKQSLII